MQEIVDRLDRIEARLAAPPRAYLPVAEAAEFMGLSKQQLDLWRMKGGGPAFHRVGRKCLYAVDDLRAFMDGLRQEPLA
ncbi:MAG: DNA-binding protein [Bacteroidetes bacterium]|nr:MAG: DNA-binding protein [Bacteroidota bacterium]